MSSEVQETTERPQKESLTRHIVRGMTLVAFLTAFMAFLSNYGVLDAFESIGLDSLIRLHRQTADSNIVVVAVTDEEYNDPKTFKGVSPLDRNLLASLIQRVAKYEPQVIGVDFDVTTHNDPDGMSFATEIDNAIAKQWKNSTHRRDRPLVIWPYIVSAAGTEIGAGETRQKFEQTLRIKDRIVFGVPRFPREPDGHVRRLAREVLVKPGCQIWPTLPFAIWNAELGAKVEPRNAPCSDPVVQEPVILRFSSEKHIFDEIDAAAFLEGGEGANHPAPDFRNALEAKTVLIGGTFEAARDTYDTPVGTLSGVDLIGYGVYTLNWHPMTFAKKVFGWFVDLFLGLIILLVSYTIQHSEVNPSAHNAVIAGLATAFLAPIACSFLVFHSGYYWISFAPAIVGAFAHIAADTLRELKELEHETTRLNGLLHSHREQASVTPHQQVTITANQIGIVQASESGGEAKPESSPVPHQ